MPLVIVGIGALEEWEAGILGLERRLEVGGIVNGMGIGVAGEQLEGVREALGEIEGQSVVPGVAVGKLSVNAVEWNRNTEADGIAGESSELLLGCVPAWDQAGERRIRSRGSEKVEEGGGTDELAVERGKRAGAT